MKREKHGELFFAKFIQSLPKFLLKFRQSLPLYREVPNPFLFLIYFAISFLFTASPIYIKSKNWTDYQNHCYVKIIGIDHLCRSSARSPLLSFCPSLRKFEFQLKFDWRFLASPSLHATNPLLIFPSQFLHLFPY